MTQLTAGNVPDENTEAALNEAERTYAVLAQRIREIVSLA